MINDAIARMSPLQRRALAVGLAVVALVLVLAVVLVPVWLLHHRYDEAITSLEDRLARYRRISAQAPEYRKALEQVRAKDSRRFFLKNTAANLAGAELLEMVRSAIESNGGRITTSQNQAPREEGRYKAVGVTFQFFATTPNLQRILYALETQQPYLVIDTLTLRPLNAFRGFRPVAGQEPELNVQMDVSALGFPAPDKPGDKGAGKAAEKAAAAGGEAVAVGVGANEPVARR